MMGEEKGGGGEPAVDTSVSLCFWYVFLLIIIKFWYFLDPLQPISANVSVNLVQEPPSVDEDIPIGAATSMPGGAAAATSTSPEDKAQAESLKTEGEMG